ncbi:hypothetical protein SLEP1_g44785 [Rubroshorea leprosula]|uniref:GPI-anchored protein LLG1-like domain-containing protein n=1 Tax=Rubroshorea leprosula TaxID=152421 RepID=A0AAV5LH71_9ROSI|nr:hypothetical protein SLEP1_g44785 [Rubroshorea leprosula]
MGLNQRFSHLFFFFLLAGFASSSTHISNDVFESHEITGPCTVDFEHQNYTIITSKCKGPQYHANLCCEALKEFACPSAEDINDLSTNCAATMFSYINLYGKYPPGLFASLCREGQNGLECKDEKADPADAATTKSSLLMLTSAFLVLFLQYFL